MGEASNCSYVTSGTVVQGCGSNQAFCCLHDGLPVCSSSACSATSGTSSSGSSLDKLIFWVILAALAGALCIVLFIVYLVCRFRKNKFDYLDGKRDSVFEESGVCESEIRTVAQAEKPVQATTVHVQEASSERRVVQVTPRPSRLPIRPTNAQSGTPRPNPAPPRDGGVSPAWGRVGGLVRQQHLTHSSLRLSQGSRASPSWSRVSAVVHQQERHPRAREAGAGSPGWGRANSLKHSRTGDGSPTGSGTPRTARKVSPKVVLPDVQ